jgi:ABC-type antimicrobial peptide transport system permease subunit
VVVTSSWTVAMLLALALAAAGTGFLIAARLLVGREPTVGPQLAVFASLSLVLTVVGLWATTAGVLVNLTVLTVVPGMSRLVKAQPSARSVFY